MNIAEQQALELLNHASSRDDQPWEFDHYVKLKTATNAIEKSNNADMMAMRESLNTMMAQARSTYATMKMHNPNTTYVVRTAISDLLVEKETQEDATEIIYRDVNSGVKVASWFLMFLIILNGLHIAIAVLTGDMSELLGMGLIEMASVTGLAGLYHYHNRPMKTGSITINKTTSFNVNRHALPEKLDKHIDAITEGRHNANRIIKGGEGNALGSLLETIGPVLESRDERVVNRINELVDEYLDQPRIDDTSVIRDAAWLDLNGTPRPQEHSTTTNKESHHDYTI